MGIAREMEAEVGTVFSATPGIFSLAIERKTNGISMESVYMQTYNVLP